MNRDDVIEMIMNPGTGPPTGSPEHREFMAYLESSPECRTLFEQQRALWETLDLWEPVEPSRDFDRRLYERIAAQGAGQGWFGRLFGGMKPSFAAGLAVLLLAAASLVYQPRPALEGSPARGVVSAEDAEYLEQMDRALDDMEMLADFDALPLVETGQGKS